MTHCCWQHDNATWIVPSMPALDSLSLLFVQTLDDFAGYACQYMNKTDDDYAMGATWQMAMLSQCPVQLQDIACPDITNPTPSEVREIWKVCFVGEKLQAVVRAGAHLKIQLLQVSADMSVERIVARIRLVLGESLPNKGE
eukprot:1540322-Amphidinium_carterae.1